MLRDSLQSDGAAATIALVCVCVSGLTGSESSQVWVSVVLWVPHKHRPLDDNADIVQVMWVDLITSPSLGMQEASSSTTAILTSLKKEMCLAFMFWICAVCIPLFKAVKY